MSEQKYYVDFLQGGDNGQATVDSIQPVTDGEPGTQNTFRRPSENLRGRTEAVRDASRDLLYYRDFNHLGIWSSAGGTLSWGGPTDSAGTGILTQVGALHVRPILTPDVSTKGALTVGTSGTNAVRYEVLPAGYITQGLDEVTVEHRDVLGSTLTATITAGPVKRILVLFDSTQTSHDSVATAAAVNVAIAADSTLNLRFQAVSDGVLGNAIFAQVETRVEGTADQEAHTIASGVLTTFTTANPLKNGDAVGIYYRYLVEEPVTLTPGGRWESNPDRSTDTISAASLFVTSNEPEKIPGAVPLFKVFNNQIVWFDGSRCDTGVTAAIGSVVSSRVMVDDSVFTGADTVVINGGIDNVLSPKSLQDALVSIDTRLHERRSVTYVLTDGTASTGGAFDSSTAVQDAITALGGAGGHLYIRRGTYVIPDTYTIPANVTLEGEGTGLVTLQPAAPASLTISSNCGLSRLTLSVGTIAVAVSGDYCTLDSVTVAGRVAFTGKHAVVRKLRVSLTTSTATTLSLAGSYNVAQDLDVVGSVTVTGVSNYVSGIKVLTSGTAPAAANVFSCSGTNCAVDNLTVLASTVALASKNLATLAGTNCTYSNVAVTGATGGLLTNCVGVTILGINLKIANVDCSMEDGVCLNIYGGSSGSLNSGRFFNNSATDVTLSYTSLAASPDFTVRNCTFYQTEQTGHRLFDINVTSTDGAQVNLSFENCIFIAASLNTFAARAENVNFYGCEFRIRNPIVSGSRRLGGQADSQTDSIFVYTGCTLTDCTINGQDAEVNDFGGVPSINAPLYARFLYTTVENLHLVQLNRYVNGGITPRYGLIGLQTESTLNGLFVQFTSTAAVQAGFASLGTIVNIEGDRVTFTGLNYNDSTNWPGGASAFFAPVQINSYISNATLRDITVGIDYKTFCGVDTGAGLGYSVIDNVVMGDATSLLGCTNQAGVIFPEGIQNRYVNSQFYINNTSGADCGLMKIAGLQEDHLFSGVYFQTLNPLGSAGGAAGYPTVTGDGNTVKRIRFVGCTWLIASAVIAPGNRDFSQTAGAHAVTFSAVGGQETAAAGNIHQCLGAALTNPPSFAANTNVW